jgi:hypothetical protein
LWRASTPANTSSISASDESIRRQRTSRHGSSAQRSMLRRRIASCRASGSPCNIARTGSTFDPPYENRI